MARPKKQRWIIEVISNHGIARRVLTETLENERRFDVRLPKTRESDGKPAALFVLDAEDTRPSLSVRLKVLRSAYPAAKFVVVGDDIRNLSAILPAGCIHGLVCQRELDADLIPTVHAVLRGHTVFPCEGESIPAVALSIKNDLGAPLDLTARERVVFGFLQCRLQNREIAGEIGVQVSTVKTHVSSILSKTGVANRRDLSVGPLFACNDPDPSGVRPVGN
jgi:DNA-binding NarL/FixJ family response regulator